MTHDTHQAYRLADEVVTLFHGRVAGPSLENLFRGRIGSVDGLPVFDTGRLRMEVITDKSGSAYAAIDPAAIILSYSPVRSSARNTLQGVIRTISDNGSSGIRLCIEAGEELTVKMTKESLSEMNLTVGSRVYLTFKSSAVEIF